MAQIPRRRYGPNVPVIASLAICAPILDARTGQKERDAEWPSQYWQATITSVGEENFLICTRDEIQLMSRDFMPLRSHVLPALTTCGEMGLSPSRRLFSVRTGVDNNLIDGESFQPLVKWSSKEATQVHFTGTLLVGTWRPDFELCVRDFNRKWQPLHIAEITQQYLKEFRYEGHSQGPTFVNDSMLSMAAGAEMNVVSLEGTILFSAKLPKKFYFTRLATSTGGKRFAYVETKLRGSRSLDMRSDFDDRIAVCDLDQKKAIYTRTIKGGSPWIPSFDEHRNRIARVQTKLPREVSCRCDSLFELQSRPDLIHLFNW
jgi:hypothetical protein